MTFWNDSVVKKLKDKDKYDIKKLIGHAEVVISKIYPVLYSTTFNLNEFNVDQAAECFIDNPNLSDIRRSLIMNALNDRPLNYIPKCKHKHQMTFILTSLIADKQTKPIIIENTYKPFNIRELDTAKIIYNEEYIH